MRYVIADALLLLGILLMAGGFLAGLRIAVRLVGEAHAAEARLRVDEQRFRIAVAATSGPEGVERADEHLWTGELR